MPGDGSATASANPIPSGSGIERAINRTKSFKKLYKIFALIYKISLFFEKYRAETTEAENETSIERKSGMPCIKG